MTFTEEHFPNLFAVYNYYTVVNPQSTPSLQEQELIELVRLYEAACVDRHNLFKLLLCQSSDVINQFTPVLEIGI